MRKKLHKILVTGGAGFIGSAFVRFLAQQGNKAVVLDKLTYAGDFARITEARGACVVYRADIADKKKVEAVMRKERPQAIVNFAAETHVDRSIQDATSFIDTNVKGTQVLLDAARKYAVEKFVHLSTDEVYGEIRQGDFRETSGLFPNSPYSASKAAADLLIKSYVRTYRFPAVILRPSNNYGPWQYPEKLIPVVIQKAMHGESVPVYARGLNVREWLYVADCAEAIYFMLKKGSSGEVYNVGSGCEKKNIEVVKKILEIMGKPHSLIRFVEDRPGHDWRYSLDSGKIRSLGWAPRVGFDAGLTQTVRWYIAHARWLQQKAGYLTGYWKKVYRFKKEG